MFETSPGFLALILISPHHPLPPPDLYIPFQRRVGAITRMHIPTTIIPIILLLLATPALSFPTPYPLADATLPADPDQADPTPTYYQPINTALDSLSQPLYYPPASKPAQSYTYTSSSPDSSVYTAATSQPSPTTDCPPTTDLPDSYTTAPPPLNPSSLTLSSPLLILPASPSPSPQPQQQCNKCCPPSSPTDWISGLGMKLAGELKETVQDVVSRLEAKCGILGGHGRGGVGNGGGGGKHGGSSDSGGHGGSGWNETTVTGCSVYGGGVICGWVLGRED
ncbi:hypothetical protein DL98DRAFT_631272 [Cadophora sp. DSE1049]|nr:hypothetical protein DL98DRAFT_631272 [Cadophora sp. DSE1049]